MTLDDFYSEFLDKYNQKDLKGSNDAIMKSMGTIMTTQRDDFIDLLRESGVEGDLNSMSDSQLIDAYVDSLSENKKLKLGTALIITMNNTQSGFDGESELNDDVLKAKYHTLCVFFGSPSENYSQASGVADAIGQVAKLGGKIAEGQQKKKYGAMDLATKKADAKAAITQQVLAQRKAEIESKKQLAETRAKTTKIVLIVSGVIAVTAIIGFIIYKTKKK